jgi:hypothetical protein
MKRRIGGFILVATLVVIVPLAAHGQGPERISIGARGVVWAVPDLESFSLALGGIGGTEIYEIDESVLFGGRPFVQLSLTRQLALELSQEFAYGEDTDIMVSSGTGIWRPFGERGLELHASICYGQFDWDGPGGFDSSWGWEIGGGYSFWLSDSVSLVVGVAYRDLSFDYEVDDLLLELAEERPDVGIATLSKESVDSAGVVGSIGVSITF